MELDGTLHPYLDACCCCHEDLSQTRDTQCHVGLTTPSHVEGVERHLQAAGHVTGTISPGVIAVLSHWVNML